MQLVLGALAVLAVLAAAAVVHARPAPFSPPRAPALAAPRWNARTDAILDHSRAAFGVAAQDASGSGTRRTRDGGEPAGAEYYRLPERRIAAGNGTAESLRGSSSPGKSAVDGTDPASFAFQVACDKRMDPSVCARAERAVTRAIARIGSVIELRRTVSVQVAFFQPCNATSTADKAYTQCELRNVLGAAAPAGVHPVQFPALADPKSPQPFPRRLNEDAFPPGRVGTLYVPQALIRQLDISVSAADESKYFSPVDISASFNALRDWWVQGDAAPIANGQEDLEYVVTHEILHGLGFGIHSFTANATVGPFLLPNTDGQSDAKNATQQFLFPMLWDAFVVDVQGVQFPSSPAPGKVQDAGTGGLLGGWLDGYGNWTSSLIRALKSGYPSASSAAAGLKLPPAPALTLASLQTPGNSYAIALRSDPALAAAANTRLQHATLPRSVVFAPGPVDEYIGLWANATNATWPVTLRLHAAATPWLGLFVDSTYNPYSDGSSLSHWDPVFAYGADPATALSAAAWNPSSPDFLMAAVTLPPSLRTRGDSIDNNRMIGGTVRGSGLGPATVAALRALGYAVRGMPAAKSDGSSVAGLKAVLASEKENMDLGQYVSVGARSGAAAAAGASGRWATVMLVAAGTVAALVAV
ncbi:hypothetical protein H9P43_009325 [Blastocladiella emersonii ATCC 22665]|nr:hypothetical protein H9P43_009325 [Blastocladiella emersonii ATCC 22665]